MDPQKYSLDVSVASCADEREYRAYTWLIQPKATEAKSSPIWKAPGIQASSVTVTVTLRRAYTGKLKVHSL